MNTQAPVKPQRKTVGDDSNAGVRIVAVVATDTELPLRWKERHDGTYVLQFLTGVGWIEVPIIEGGQK